MSVRAILTKACHGTIDQARIDRAQILITQPVPRKRAGAEIFDQHIRLCHDALQDGRAFRLREIQAERAFVAIERGEISAVITPRHKGRAERTQIIAIALAFQLDDFGAQIAQHLCAKRAGYHARQVNHAQAGKRTRFWEFCHAASAPAHAGAQFEFLDFAGCGFR